MVSTGCVKRPANDEVVIGCSTPLLTHTPGKAPGRCFATAQGKDISRLSLLDRESVHHRETDQTRMYTVCMSVGSRRCVLADVPEAPDGVGGQRTRRRTYASPGVPVC